MAETAVATKDRLAVSGLDAGYFGQAVVRGLNLRVAPGEVVALLGSNAAGKPPTLSTIARLLPPMAGTIEIDGEEISGQPTHKLARRGVSLVPEGRALFVSLTVREHLKLAAGGGDGLDQAELLEMLPELEKCLDRKAGVL